jgi:hypothetical protein
MGWEEGRLAPHLWNKRGGVVLGVAPVGWEGVLHWVLRLWDERRGRSGRHGGRGGWVEVLRRWHGRGGWGGDTVMSAVGPSQWALDVGHCICGMGGSVRVVCGVIGYVPVRTFTSWSLAVGALVMEDLWEIEQC